MSNCPQSCNNNASNPPFTGNQGSNLNCVLNALVATLSQSISDVVGYPVSVDLGFLKCSMQDMDNKINPKLIDLIALEPDWLQTYNALRSSNICGGFTPTPQQIQSYEEGIKILYWLEKFGGKSGVYVPITCEKTKQSTAASCFSYDPNCQVYLKLTIKKTNKNTQPKDIISAICKHGIVTTIAGSGWLSDEIESITSNPSSIPIFDTTGRPPIIRTGTDCGHAVAITNFECDGNSVVLTIQDSYTWGKNPNNNIRIFKLRFPLSSFFSNPPISFGLDGFPPITAIVVASNQKKKVTDAIKKCCSGICCKDGDCIDAKTERLCNEAGGTWIKNYETCEPKICYDIAHPINTIP